MLTLHDFFNDINKFDEVFGVVDLDKYELKPKYKKEQLEKEITEMKGRISFLTGEASKLNESLKEKEKELVEVVKKL
jgi:predicted  nucleic acid-binding Zn-ribbon protein